MEGRVGRSVPLSRGERYDGTADLAGRRSLRGLRWKSRMRPHRCGHGRTVPSCEPCHDGPRAAILERITVGGVVDAADRAPPLNRCAPGFMG